MAVLVDPKMSGLPAFLVENSGVNSGFMIAQVTAAALVSENKTIATPCSVDSIPTSANQEDHVSMATHAARRLSPMVDNAAAVIGIELLAAAQGIDFHRPAPILLEPGTGSRRHPRGCVLLFGRSVLCAGYPGGTALGQIGTLLRSRAADFAVENRNLRSRPVLNRLDFA